MTTFNNGEFTATRDKYGWSLVQKVASDHPKATNGFVNRQSFHANLTQCCKYMLDVKAGQCQEAAEIIELLNSAEKMIEDRLE